MEREEYLTAFRRGELSEGWRFFGAHREGELWRFRVWAPNARAVSVVGEFNGWNADADPMMGQDGIWEAWLPGPRASQLYQYAILGCDGVLRYKTDPYAFAAELRPGTAGRLTEESDFPWGDGRFRRERRTVYGGPLNIYEVHLGSWRRREDGGFLSYRELGEQLADYVRDMGYTAVASGAANAYDWQPMYSSDEAWMADNALERKALDYFIHNAGSPDGVVEGGIAVFAGGNESAPAAGYPGAYGDFVSVAATAADWTPAVYTNYGTGTTISAPGGDQDYYWNYGEGSERGTLGCVLSTLPLTVSPSGYGYMEGTSMACPHVSGVVDLGLSYAARLHRHFKASEIIDLLYSSATPVEQYWNIDEPKYYYKYVTDLGTNYRNSMDLRRYAGGMGSGQVNASAFLRAIEGSGVEMTFPNVTVAPGSSVKLALRTYFDNLSGASVKVDDGSIAEASIVSGKLVVKGLAEGQSSAVISADGKSHRFVVSVRSNLSEGGWL